MRKINLWDILITLIILMLIAIAYLLYKKYYIAGKTSGKETTTTVLSVEDDKPEAQPDTINCNFEYRDIQVEPRGKLHVGQHITFYFADDEQTEWKIPQLRISAKGSSFSYTFRRPGKYFIKASRYNKLYECDTLSVIISPAPDDPYHDYDGDGVTEAEGDPDDRNPEISRTTKGVSAPSPPPSSPDSNNNGIPDNQNTYPQEAGLSSNNGFTQVPLNPDPDGDGVLRVNDECKTRRGTVSNNGCPEVIISMPRQLYMGSDATLEITYNDRRESDDVTWSSTSVNIGDPKSFSPQISANSVGKYEVRCKIKGEDGFTVTKRVSISVKVSENYLANKLQNLANYGNEPFGRTDRIVKSKKTSLNFLNKSIKSKDIKVTRFRESSSGKRIEVNTTTYKALENMLLTPKIDTDDDGITGEGGIFNVVISNIKYGDDGKIISFDYSYKQI